LSWVFVQWRQRTFQHAAGSRQSEHGTLMIRQHPHADAWICELPNGKRVVGQFLDVRRAVEAALASQGLGAPPVKISDDGKLATLFAGDIKC
jgi:hypothetical protein